MNEVVGGVVRPFHVGLVVDHRRTVENRFVLVEDRGEHLVGHVDQVDRSQCDLLRVGRHGRHPVADVADPVVEAHLVVGERDSGSSVRPTHTERGEHCRGGGRRARRGVRARRNRRCRRSWRSRAGCRGPWRSSVPDRSTSSVKAGLPLASLMASTLISAFPTTSGFRERLDWARPGGDCWSICRRGR